MNKTKIYFILTIMTISLTACSGSQGGTKGQLLSSINKSKNAVITNSITLTFPKNGTGNWVSFMRKTNTDQYIADHYLLLEKSAPTQGSLLQKMLSDGYITKQKYTVTEDYQGLSSFSKESSPGANSVFVYFLTKKGEKYFSKDTSLINAGDAMSYYLVKITFYKEIPDHILDYSVPSGSTGQNVLTANVDFRIAKAAPDDIFTAVKYIAEKNGQKVPKVGSFVKHQCEFTKMSDGYQLNACL